MAVLKQNKPDKYRKMAAGEDTGAPLLKFFNEEDCSAIYFQDGAKDMSCYSFPPASNKKKLFCMLKPRPAKYTKAGEMEGIIMFDVSPKLLESMHATMEGVFLPIMSNPKNQQARGAPRTPAIARAGALASTVGARCRPQLWPVAPGWAANVELVEAHV